MLSRTQLLQGWRSSTLQRILRHWQKEQALLARLLKVLEALKVDATPMGPVSCPIEAGLSVAGRDMLRIKRNNRRAVEAGKDEQEFSMSRWKSG